MKFSSIIALAAAAKLAHAHATVFAVFINGVDQGVGNTADGYIRSPPSNSPITDVKSTSMTCNVNNSPVPKTLSVKAGDELTFEWHHDKRDASDDIIADSHKGPVLTYMAPTASNGKGNVWVKLAEEGYTNGKWAVDNLITNRGKHSITIPDVEAGEYLLRPEIIALHEGFMVNGAQFYMECVQIKVTSKGSKKLPAGVAIPGVYTAEDPGIHRNIYPMSDDYKIPGPPVWKGAASYPVPPSQPGPSSQPASAPTSQQTSATSSTSRPTFTATTFVQAPSPTAASPSGSVPEWGQCGGKDYRGSTACAAGLTCKRFHEWYSQCQRSS